MASLSPHILSTPTIIGAVAKLIEECLPGGTGNHLDIGSGNGELIELLRQKFKFTSVACDYTDTLMRIPGQKVDIVDLNRGNLPYASGTFDVVTMTEVIEHIENGRAVLREIYRVLKPGGLAIITTPNILNVKSRLRFLGFGFWNLFGPLHVQHSEKYSTGGHINPISYFYIAHALSDAGFTSIELSIDKIQNSSLIPLIFLYLPIKLSEQLALRKEKRRYHTIDEHNERFVLEMNSLPALLGRTIIVSARKP